MVQMIVFFGPLIGGVLFLLSACSSHLYNGNGHWVTQKRSVAVYDRINISGHFKLTYQDHAGESVSVSGDQNLLPYVRTHVKHGELMIDTAPGVRINPSKVITIHLRNHSIEQLTSTGVNEVELSHLNEHVLRVNASGGSQISLRGKVDDVLYQGEGVSQINATDLIAYDAHAQLTGASVLHTHVDHRLDAKLAGSSQLRYTGSPEVISNASGLSKVLPLQA